MICVQCRVKFQDFTAAFTAIYRSSISCEKL